MAKILCIGDPHLKITRFDLAKQFLEWINKLIQDIKPDIVVNLGDTFDTHAVIRSEVMREFKDHVDYVLSLGIKYYYILGNHDMFRPNDSKYHALQTFKGNHKDFIVVDKRLDHDNLTFIPHMYDHRQFPLDTKEICFAHQTFVGADYGYIRPEVGVMAEDVAAEIIISGHIHIKQEFGKVIYPGSPYSQSSNDIDQIKGVMLFDTTTYNKKFYACPMPMWYRLNYELSSSMRIIDIHTDLQCKTNDHDHWIAHIVGPKSEIVGYVSSKDFKELRKSVDIVIKPDFTDKEKRLVKIEAMSMESIMQEYVDRVYKGPIDKDILKSKVIEIIEEANRL